MAISDPRGLVPYIRATAAKYGINPDIAVKVAQSEGLDNFTSGIPGEDSFGAFQLNTQGGLGNDFQKATGLDPSDPANEQAGIDYALKYASQNGWTAFHGAKNRYGFGPWEGIDPSTILNQAPLTPGSPAPPLPAGTNIDQPTPQAAPQAQGLLAGVAAQKNGGLLAALGNQMIQGSAKPLPPPSLLPIMRRQVNLAPLQQMLAQRPPLGWSVPSWNGNGWTFG